MPGWLAGPRAGRKPASLAVGDVQEQTRVWFGPAKAKGGILYSLGLLSGTVKAEDLEDLIA